MKTPCRWRRAGIVICLCAAEAVISTGLKTKRAEPSSETPERDAVKDIVRQLVATEESNDAFNELAAERAREAAAVESTTLAGEASTNAALNADDDVDKDSDDDTEDETDQDNAAEQPDASQKAQSHSQRNKDSSVDTFGNVVKKVEFDIAVPSTDVDIEAVMPDATEAVVKAVAMAANATADIQGAADTGEAMDTGGATDSEGDAALASVAASASPAASDPQYFRDRVANLEHENADLRKMLEKADNYQGELLSKVTKTSGELREMQELERRLRKLEAEKRNEEAQLKTEYGREQSLEFQVLNSTRTADHYAEAVQLAQSKVMSLQNENAGLAHQLRNASATNRQLRSKLRAVEQSHQTFGKAFKVVRTEFDRVKAAASKQRKEFDKLVAEKTNAEEQAQAAEQVEDQEHQRNAAATQTIDELRAELAATTRRLRGEESRERELQDANSKFVGLVKAGRDNAARSAEQLQQSQSQTRELEIKVDFLKRRVDEDDKAMQRAQATTNSTESRLARAEAEVKQLRGAVPWLKAKVVTNQELINKSASEARLAYEARDAAQALLGETQRKMVQLEKQYAAVVQELASKDGTEDGVSATVLPDEDVASAQQDSTDSSTVSTEPQHTDDDNGNDIADLFAVPMPGEDGLPRRSSREAVLPTSRKVATDGDALARDSQGLNDLLVGS